MTHPMVEQLRFTRDEFMRGVANLSDADARRRLLPMNCISWNIGHLAWQEQRYFLYRGMGQVLLPWVQEQFAYGAAGSTPPLAEVLDAWGQITAAADPWLDELAPAKLSQLYTVDGKPGGTTYGNLLQRTIYHYWYHTGENAAIRQTLGHTNLPQFVGDVEELAPYRPG